MRPIVKILLSMLIIIPCLTIGGGFFFLKHWATHPLSLTAPQVFEFPQKTSLGSLSQKLEQQGLVSNSVFFYLYIRSLANYQRFQAGRYRFSEMVSPEQIAQTLESGKVYHEIVLSITIPEGFTQKQIIERLAAHKVGHLVELQRHTKDQKFIEALGIEAESLEGYLYPATYSFTQMPTAEQALSKMVQTFWQNLPKNYLQEIKKRGLSLHDAVTFASLIEAETLHDDERAKVSEVIWARLKDHTPLGIDAAIIYGIPNYDGDLKSVHLTDKKNQFNTRIHKGLPPSPIGNPASASLAAVLAPSDQGYYYYVLIPGSNRHHFSLTLKEHNEHVRKLVNALKENKL